jgi:tRNA threonylcarbamoyladenosine biosynthesis protein TsaB
MAFPLASGAHAQLLLALSVQWDDCSVALGTRSSLTTEVWSQQPERARAAPAADSHTLASRDALVLVDRILVRTGTPLSAVDRLCFAQGPGAFTSLRVAAGLIQGLSLAIAKPVAGISSLAAMAAHEPAWQLPPGGQADGRSRMWLQLSAIDARMGECYFGLHQCRSGHYPEPLVSPAVGKPADAVAVFEHVLLQQRAGDSQTPIVLAGNAFGLLPALAQWARVSGFDPAEAARRSPDAAAVLAVAASAGAPAGGPPAQALPVYVRDKIAFDVDEQRDRAAARALAAASAADPR